MAAQIDYDLDIDPDQKWYDWGDLLTRDHLTLPGIVAGIPQATSPEDHTLRTLTISRWLSHSGVFGGGLQVGFDEDGVVAQCPHRQPFFKVMLNLEDMTTRPEQISRREVDIATSQPDLVRGLVAQWLPFSQEIDIDEIMDEHYARMSYWDEQIHQQEILWFSKDTSFVMGVVIVETPDGDTVGCFDCMQEIVKMPHEHREKLFGGGNSKHFAPLWESLSEIHQDIAMDTVSLGPAHFSEPSPARLAVMHAREIDTQTPQAPHANKGLRL